MNVFILFCVGGDELAAHEDAEHTMDFVSTSFYKCLDHIHKEDLEKHFDKFIINEYEVDKYLPVASWHYFKSDSGIDNFENWIKCK